MQSSHIKDAFAGFKEANAARRSDIVLELTAWALKNISSDLIIELGKHYEKSPELYCAVARRLLPDETYHELVESEVTRLASSVLDAHAYETKQRVAPSAVQQLIQKHGMYPANLPLYNLDELCKHVLGSSGGSNRADWLEVLREGADLAELRLIIVDKSSRNNIVYQAKTLIDYEYIKARDIFTQATAGVSKKVQERTRTIDTLPADPAFPGVTSVYDLGPQSSQTYSWIEKHGDMFSVMVVPDDITVDEYLRPDPSVEAYNRIMEDELIKHLHHVKKQDKMIAKSDVQVLREKILTEMMEIVSRHVNAAKPGDLSALTGLTKRANFYSELIRKIQDVVLDSVLSQRQISDRMRRELQFTFLYETENIVKKFRSMFEYAYGSQRDKFRNILDGYNDQKLINEHVINLMKYMITDILRRLIADRKSISQMLNVKYTMLKQYEH